MPPRQPKEAITKPDAAVYEQLDSIQGSTIGHIALSGTRIGGSETLAAKSDSHQQLLDNLSSFIESEEAGLGATSLREHQQTVFHDIYSFLAEPPLREDGKPIRRGYVQMPTGSGKTAIFSTLVEALSEPKNQGEERLKTLVLVPKLDLVEQTIGRNGERGFAQFGKRTRVTEYTGDTKDLSGDAVVMTYQSLNNAVKAGVLGPDVFDLIICDEAHRALGEQTSAALDRVANGKLVIGLTATPDFKTRKIESVFPEKIHGMELREAIENGLLAPIQCFAIASDSKIETIKSRSDFTEGEMAGLIEDEWRNQKAIEFAKSFIETGKQGLISCVPGEDVRHARDLAESLSNEFIIDKLSGDLRRIRAISISGETDNRQDLYEAYDRGEIDIFTYVDVLTEGWDSQKAKFLINLRPTTSPVNAVQRIGRILRKSEDGQVATVIEFVDKTDKNLYTFFHALGESTIEQGKVHKKRNGDDNGGGVEPGGGDSGGDGGGDGGDKQLTFLPYDLQQLIKEIDHIEVARLLIDSMEKSITDETVVSVKQFAEHFGIAAKTMLRLCDELGFEPETYTFTYVKGKGLTAEQQNSLVDLISSRAVPAPNGVVSTTTLAEQLGLHHNTLAKIVEGLELDLPLYRFGSVTAPGLDTDAVSKIVATPEYRKFNSLTKQEFREGLSVNQFATVHGIDRSSVDTILDKHGLSLPYARFGTRVARSIGPDEQAIILASPEFQRLKSPVAPEGVLTLNGFAKQIGVSHKVVYKRVADLGLELDTFRFGHRVDKGLTPEMQAQIADTIR